VKIDSDNQICVWLHALLLAERGSGELGKNLLLPPGIWDAAYLAVKEPSSTRFLQEASMFRLARQLTSLPFYMN
jgi:hypothetical protein